jgi:hypothetical protein
MWHFDSDLVLRSNPKYELVTLGQMTATEEHLFQELRGSTEIIALLRPRNGATLPYRAVSKDLALVFLLLRDSGPCDESLLRESCGRSPEAVLAGLVADAVFEVETPDGFRSGADATELIFGTAPTIENGPTGFKDNCRQ